MEGRGRPRKEKDEVKTHVHGFRMNSEDVQMMDFIRVKTGKTGAEILREGLRMQFNLAKYTD